MKKFPILDVLIFILTGYLAYEFAGNWEGYLFALATSVQAFFLIRYTRNGSD